MRLPVTIQIVTAAACLAAFAPTVSAQTVQSRGDGTIPPYAAPCDTADVLALIGDKGPMERAPLHAAALIRGRIRTCRGLIDAYQHSVPTPPPAIVTFPTSLPTLPPSFSLPPADCDPKSPLTLSDDRMKLYGILGTCVAYLKSIPSPSPSTSPSPIGYKLAETSDAASIQTKTIFALAIAGDAPTSAQLALRLATEVAPRLSNDGKAVDLYTGKPVRYRIVAQPTWTLAQYQQQCMSDPSTRGAIVVLPPGTQSAVANALLVSTSWTTVDLQTMVLDCEPTNVAFVNSAGYVTWVSGVKSDTGRRWGLPLASLLGAVSGVTALRPTHTTTTTQTYAIAAPSPAPPPGTKTKTGEQSQDQTTSNPNGNALIIASSVLTPVSSATVGQVGSTDSQFAAAAKRVIPALVTELAANCTKKQPLSSNDYLAFPTQCFWLAP